ncbi:MAG: sugar isomerase domain-containing protein [Lentisphaeria bacterium]|nr:sugar isomerase domain-containing protein [Lentisphaeria bacterium]
MDESRFLPEAHRILTSLAQQQRDNIAAAADLIADCLGSGGGIYCAEIGHGIQMDFINRAGGLCAVQPFTFTVAVNTPGPECRRKAEAAERADQDIEAVRLAVAHSALRAGDAMLIGSVSGRNRRPVELALACRAKGVKVVGFTAMAYTRKVTSLHPSGKRLFEVCDVVVDNGAPYGDAGVQVPGYEHPVIPLSGFGMLTAGWLIWEQVLSRMAAAGTPASVLISQNREDGPPYNAESRAGYNRKGF